MQTSERAPRYGELARFHAPVALQAMSQALTYPLVTMVASRGAGGALNAAGLAQSNQFMFFLASTTFGLITTGLAFSATREGYRRFVHVNYMFLGSIALLHALFIIPALSHVVFGKLMGLTPALEQPTRLTFALCLPLQVLFVLRNPYQVALVSARMTMRATAATLGRIVLTAALSPLFCAMGLVGPVWAVVCLTIPLGLEVVVSWALARGPVRALEQKQTAEAEPTHAEILRFGLTVSLGYVFLSMAGYLVASIIARAASPERVLPAYYFAQGLAGPCTYGATRVQALVISFSSGKQTNTRLVGYAVVAGGVLGVLPLAAVMPGVITFYYHRLQQLPVADLGLARATACALVLVPLMAALRAYGEGRAAYLRRPEVILVGQATFMGTVTATAFFALNLGVAGNLIGALALAVGNLCAAGTVMLVLGTHWRSDAPLPPTRPAAVAR